LARKESLSAVVAIMLVLLLVDASCGPEISPWIAYAVPVAIASRYCGFPTGAAYSVIAAGLILVAARHSGHPYSGDAYFAVAVVSQALALLAIAWLTARLSSLERVLQALHAWRGDGTQPRA
jgi:hypothetical protein